MRFFTDLWEKVVQPDGTATDEESAPDGTALAAATALDVPAERRRDEEELSELAVRSRELLAETRATHLATRRAAEELAAECARATTEGGELARTLSAKLGEAELTATRLRRQLREAENIPPQTEGTAPSGALAAAVGACGAGGAIVGAASGQSAAAAAASMDDWVEPPVEDVGVDTDEMYGV